MSEPNSEHGAQGSGDEADTAERRPESAGSNPFLSSLTRDAFGHVADYTDVRTTATLAQTSTGMVDTFGNVVDRQLEKAVGEPQTDGNFGNNAIARISKDLTKQGKYFIRLRQLLDRFPQPTDQWLLDNNLVNDWLEQYSKEYVDRQLRLAVDKSEATGQFGDNVMGKLLADATAQNAYFARLHQLRRQHEELVQPWLAANPQITARFDTYLDNLRKPSRSKPGTTHRGSFGDVNGESRAMAGPFGGSRVTPEGQAHAHRAAGAYKDPDVRSMARFTALSGCKSSLLAYLVDTMWRPSSNDLKRALSALTILLTESDGRRWIVGMFADRNGFTYRKLKRAWRAYIERQEDLSDKQKKDLIARIPK